MSCCERVSAVVQTINDGVQVDNVHERVPFRGNVASGLNRMLFFRTEDRNNRRLTRQL